RKPSGGGWFDDSKIWATRSLLSPIRLPPNRRQGVFIPALRAGTVAPEGLCFLSPIALASGFTVCLLPREPVLLYEVPGGGHGDPPPY
ncbi:MAG: hypothetical protein ACOX87_05390, partial [Chloroflexota bacterium]